MTLLSFPFGSTVSTTRGVFFKSEVLFDFFWLAGVDSELDIDVLGRTASFFGVGFGLDCLSEFEVLTAVDAGGAVGVSDDEARATFFVAFCASSFFASSLFLFISFSRRLFSSVLGVGVLPPEPPDLLCSVVTFEVAETFISIDPPDFPTSSGRDPFLFLDDCWLVVLLLSCFGSGGFSLFLAFESLSSFFEGIVESCDLSGFAVLLMSDSLTTGFLGSGFDF
mmetsp:Transcript_21404/g.26990  ORF Transcript_21404/g.26990 Transcript_21404/m.26990 type:complete len:223 (-) Transcript_21404:74-742(-)